MSKILLHQHVMDVCFQKLIPGKCALKTIAYKIKGGGLTITGTLFKVLMLFPHSSAMQS